MHTTVREANDRGFRCIVPGDCCGSYFPEFHEVGLRMIKAQGGIFGWVSDSTRVVWRAGALGRAAASEIAEEEARRLDEATIRRRHRRSDRQRGAAWLKKPKLWTPGDWNAFFGFGTNILVNLLVLTGLLRFVLKMPDALVFGRILPATGLCCA